MLLKFLQAFRRRMPLIFLTGVIINRAIRKKRGTNAVGQPTNQRVWPSAAVVLSKGEEVQRAANRMDEGDARGLFVAGRAGRAIDMETYQRPDCFGFIICSLHNNDT